MFDSPTSSQSFTSPCLSCSGAQFETLEQARSVLIQVTYALAIAEAKLSFEHRDLHWGNVLVKTTDEEVIEYVLDGRTIPVRSHGVKVSIIDFTLSRLNKGSPTVTNDVRH